MIQALIDTLLARLAIPFEGVQLIGGPIPVELPQELPAVVISPGPFAVSPSGKGEASDEPRPQPARQLISVRKNRTSPFRFDHAPLKDSLRVRAITNPGKLTEFQTLLIEGKDFTVDYEKERLALTEPVNEAFLMAVDYSYVGVYAIQEFRQDMLLDAYGADMTTAEQWASLAISLLLTTTGEILEAANVAAKDGYRASPFSATHRFQKMQFIEGLPGAIENAFKIQLKFIVNGQTRVMKDLSGGYGIIEAIHSPGKTKVVGVDVDVQVRY